MAAGPIAERNQDATIYVGGLDEKVSESLLWELFLQGGPVVNVHMPKDRITQQHQGYGFVEFLGEEDADYSIKIMNMIKVFGKPIRVNKASAHNKNLDVGANIFIGNLDPEIDEKLLYDTFSAFGVILQTPKIMRDTDTGNSKGFAFINFASFEAADAAIEAMNGQYLCNRAISVSYAFKKDSKGERHGSAAERVLASQNPLTQADRPHQLFADAPPTQPTIPPVASSIPMPMHPPNPVPMMGNQHGMPRPLMPGQQGPPGMPPPGMPPPGMPMPAPPMPGMPFAHHQHMGQPPDHQAQNHMMQGGMMQPPLPPNMDGPPGMPNMAFGPRPPFMPPPGMPQGGMPGPMPLMGLNLQPPDGPGNPMGMPRPPPPAPPPGLPRPAGF